MPPATIILHSVPRRLYASLAPSAAAAAVAIFHAPSPMVVRSINQNQCIHHIPLYSYYTYIKVAAYDITPKFGNVSFKDSFELISELHVTSFVKYICKTFLYPALVNLVWCNVRLGSLLADFLLYRELLSAYQYTLSIWGGKC